MLLIFKWLLIVIALYGTSWARGSRTDEQTGLRVLRVAKPSDEGYTEKAVDPRAVRNLEYSRRAERTSEQDANGNAGVGDRDKELEKKSVFGDRLKSMIDSRHNDEDKNQGTEEETERGGDGQGVDNASTGTAIGRDGTMGGGGGRTMGEGGTLQGAGTMRGRGRKQGGGRTGGGRLRGRQRGELILVLQESRIYEVVQRFM